MGAQLAAGASHGLRHGLQVGAHNGHVHDDGRGFNVRYVWHGSLSVNIVGYCFDPMDRDSCPNIRQSGRFVIITFKIIEKP
jgi:hypothetical protein